MIDNPIARIMVDFKQMKQFVEDPLVIERGQGIRLWDVNGKEYIDGLAGVFVASVGHANPAIIETITDQLHKLTFSPPLASTNLPAIALAARLSELTPPQYNLVKFTSGGSEAIEMALKMALQYHKQTGHPGKYRFISAYGAYHGGTLGALSASGTPARRVDLRAAHGQLRARPPAELQALPAGAGSAPVRNGMREAVRNRHPTRRAGDDRGGNCRAGDECRRVGLAAAKLLPNPARDLRSLRCAADL